LVAKIALTEKGQTFAWPLRTSCRDASTSVVISGEKASGSAELACGHLARFVVALELEAELLTFDDRIHACAFNSRDVNEHVGAAVVGLNEAEALGGVEPFNCASGHNEPFLSNIDHRWATHSGVSIFERGKFVKRRAKRSKTNIGKPSIDALS
jgi:hypothetical protein